MLFRSLRKFSSVQHSSGPSYHPEPAISLSKLKCPRSIEFDADLPRLPTGKLYKKALRDRFWSTKVSRIV